MCSVALLNSCDLNFKIFLWIFRAWWCIMLRCQNEWEKKAFLPASYGKIISKNTYATNMQQHAFVKHIWFFLHICCMPTVWESCTCAGLSQNSCVDVWSLSMRHPHHISIIPQFNTTDRHLRNKRHFHQPLGGGDKEKKNGSLLAFQTYRFHVNGHWNAKILSAFFPPDFFLSFLSFCFFLICSSFAPKDLVPGHDMPNYLRYQLCHWQCIVSL